MYWIHKSIRFELLIQRQKGFEISLREIAEVLMAIVFHVMIYHIEYLRDSNFIMYNIFFMNKFPSHIIEDDFFTILFVIIIYVNYFF